MPLSLTKTAKSQLKKKGKVTVRARITFTPQGLPGRKTVANTQTAKLKIKAKTNKKQVAFRNPSFSLQDPPRSRRGPRPAWAVRQSS